MDRATEHFGSGTPRTEGDEWASTIARTVVVLGPRPLPRELSRLLLHSRRLPLALGLLPLGSSFPRQAVVTADHTRSFLRLALDAFDAYAGTAPVLRHVNPPVSIRRHMLRFIHSRHYPKLDLTNIGVSQGIGADGFAARLTSLDKTIATLDVLSLIAERQQWRIA